MFCTNDILRLYGVLDQEGNANTPSLNVAVDYNAQKVQNNLRKRKYNVINVLQNHQMNFIRSNRKLLFTLHLKRSKICNTDNP